jgi:hypothetical protein
VDAVSLTPHARFLRAKINRISAIEAEFQKALACESRDQWVMFNKKTEGHKNCDTVPLTLFIYCMIYVR